ncbi:MAG: precorrin-4 C(11)-methyltransferase [Gammaproteobacteria bacterium]|nr:precorrin-4 C(11)-methyltransferase [Gammaproteobacteria bacterium]
MTVYFIGAGPGDPELITVRGQRLISECPVILYAGSLVPEAVLEKAAAGAQLINTAELHLEQIVAYIKAAHQSHHDVARVHSGDPSLYGAIGEQIRELERLNIPYNVVPGVTATAASAALLKKELTLPDVSQTVILTRYAGKTPMPEKESLEALAKHGATLAIHLGITKIHRIAKILIPKYGEDCPVAVIFRASWPDQQVIRGTLATIAEKVREAKIKRTALILVGRVLDESSFTSSRLYHEDHAHIFRPKMR